jgi:hypothetical protein
MGPMDTADIPDTANPRAIATATATTAAAGTDASTVDRVSALEGTLAKYADMIEAQSTASRLTQVLRSIATENKMGEGGGGEERGWGRGWMGGGGGEIKKGYY